jgi:PAS domain S-box-containing protein
MMRYLQANAIAVPTAHHHTHDLALVVLSVVIAIFASYTALDLANSVTVARGKARAAWLLGGSMAMGVGIWSMHFVAMLAFSLPGVPIAYDIYLLILSILVAVVASAIALSIVSRGRVTVAAYIFGSLAMGIAIAGMHYIGIASMRMAARWEWNYLLVVTSIVIAITASFAALQIAFRLRSDLSRRGFWFRGLGGIVMGLAISGMHYTAMAAMTFFPNGSMAFEAEQLLATSGLAVAVIGTTLLILGIALTGSLVGRAMVRRETMAQQMRGLLERLQLALDATKMGTWSWDLRSGKISWDETNELLFGIPPQSFGGSYEAFQTLLHPDDRDRVRDAVSLALENRSDFESEYRVIWPNQSTHWILFHGRPFYDEQGKALRVLGTSLDITERKQIEEAVRGALQARNEFISVASHELKTPITSIRMQIQVMDRAFKKDGPGAIEPKQLAHMFELSTRQLDRLTRLVEDMLDISRISTGRLSMEMAEHDMSQLIADIAERFESDCAAAGCELRCRIEPTLTGYFDSFRFEQVVTNLLSNAVKYGAGKPIEVQLRMKTPERVVFQVRDFGMGISKEAQARIFNRFERAVSGTGISGLGLGLYIVKNIVDAHGGSVQVESEPGQGALFTVELPIGRK